MLIPGCLFLSSLILRFGFISADICDNIVCEELTCPDDHIEVPRLRGLHSCCSGCVQYKKLGEENCRTSHTPIIKSDCHPLFTSNECERNLKCDEDKHFNLVCSYNENKPCTGRLNDFSEDEVKSDWFWRPECDIHGNFKPKQCKQDKCFCVDQKGIRIFGSFTREENTNCACPLMELKLQERAKFGKSKHTGHFDHVVCQLNGDFNRLQCIRDICFCVNETSGIVTSIMVPKTVVQRLPCYIDENNLISVFNTPCQIQREYEERVASYYIQKDLPLTYLHPTRCSPDGTFHVKQCTSKHCFCANPQNGLQIEGYNVPFRSRLAENMNCQCVLDMLEVTADGGHQSFDCAVGNGNYRKIACHGYICYCLDTDGFRESEELNVSPWIDNFCLISDFHKRVRECYKEGYEIDCTVT